MARVTRRAFLGSAASVAATGGLFTPAVPPALGERTSPDLPWKREIPLRVAARSVFVEGILHPSDPTPNVLGLHQDAGQTLTMALTNPALKSSLWGPSHRITLSIIKTDVQDRRVKWPDHILTLQEMRDGAYSPANKDRVPPSTQKTRPVKGYLVESGGRSAPYLTNWHAYPFPCQKPVGQIILMLDDLQDAPSPKLTQSCASGLVRFQLEKASARANLEIVLSMTRNVYAIRGTFTGLSTAARLRLYRHQDQAHLLYMTPEGKFRTDGIPNDVTKPHGPVMELDGHTISFDYQTDAAWNGPIDSPESGTDGRYFWIRQKMPAEKTFPQGFHYVMMGLVAQPSKAELHHVNGESGLGTPPPEQTIRHASGSAATATSMPDDSQAMTAYVVIVSQIDAADFMAEARRRLDAAEADGFDRIVQENTQWYGDLYEKRESGRVFYGDSGQDATEEIADVYSSWYCRHGGGCKTDMRLYQASAHYSNVETDAQPWHGYPCYNEWFYTPSYVRNRADSVDMWKQIVEHWWQASRENARQAFGMPGMAMLHGYLAPVKADKYLHTNEAMELCLDTLAQVLKSLWEEWDYGGDHDFLKFAYPMLRDMAVFYAAYAKKAEDGYYHLNPAMQAECWGIYPDFSHSLDSIGALAMFRWALLRTAEAAEVLGQDADLCAQWREIAGRMAPYPVWKKPEGVVFAGVRGVEPFWSRGDHPWYEGVYPTTLADELNLDSSAEQKEMMIRTAKVVPAAPNAEALVLLGACPDMIASVQDQAPRPIRDWKALRMEVNRYPERLVNSRSGRIHLFPCVPQTSVIAFRRFQARGGLLISAAKDETGTYFVEIEARQAATCTFVNPWPGRRVVIRTVDEGKIVPFKVDRSNGECLVFSTRKDRSYRIERS